MKLNIGWFKNPDNIVYAERSDFIPNFEKEAGIAQLEEKLRGFEENPAAEGVLIQGKKRTSIKMIIPDLVFEEHLDMGENVWLYLGENYPCYCLYEKRN